MYFYFVLRIAARIGIFHIHAQFIQNLVQRIGRLLLDHIADFLIRFFAQISAVLFGRVFEQMIIAVHDLVALRSYLVLVALDVDERILYDASAMAAIRRDDQ